MKLETPSKHQLISYTKKTIVFTIVLFVLVFWILKQDQNIEKIKVFLSSNNKISKKIGNIKNTSLIKVTYVQDGILLDGTHTNGYNSYLFKVFGVNGDFLVVVRADKTNAGERSLFKVESIEIY